MTTAVRAPRHELRRGYVEDRGQLLDFLGREAPLSAVAVPFGGAHGGGALPAHQFTKLALSPSPTLAKGTDVRADDSALLAWQLARRAAPSSRHALVFLVSTA